MKLVEAGYNTVVMNAFSYWHKNIAVADNEADFRLWLKTNYDTYLNRDWVLIGFESPAKELMFMLRFS